MIIFNIIKQMKKDPPILRRIKAADLDTVVVSEASHFNLLSATRILCDISCDIFRFNLSFELNFSSCYRDRKLEFEEYAQKLFGLLKIIVRSHKYSYYRYRTQ